MERIALFRDRTDAGRAVVRKLADYAGQPDIVVLALSPGGVPVALEVAEALKAPLDLFLVHKLRVPGREDLAMGAVASGGALVLNQDTIRMLNIPGETVEVAIDEEQQKLERRERPFRGGRPRPEIKGKTVILVDDGLAAGASMWPAVMALRSQQPARIVMAVPMAAPQLCELFENEVDDIVCVETAGPLYGVETWYGELSRVSEAEIRQLLQQAADPDSTDNDRYYGIR